MRISDWSSDVCSSDLPPRPPNKVFYGRSGGGAGWCRSPRIRTRIDSRSRRFASRVAPSGAKSWTVTAQQPHPGGWGARRCLAIPGTFERKTAMRRSEEHTSELQSLMRISYAVFCLKKKITNNTSDLVVVTTSGHINNIHTYTVPYIDKHN